MARQKTNFVWFTFALLMIDGSRVLAASGPSDFECFSDQPESEICLVVPPESPASLPNASQLPTTQPLIKAKPIPRMVSSREVTGHAVAGPDRLGPANAVEEFRTTRQEALAASYQSLENLRWIETFLKTGPSALSDDIRVQPASRRVPGQN